MEDIHNMPAADLAAIFRTLPPIMPISHKYQQHYWGNRKLWYSTQKEHMIGWFSEAAGPGAYGRKTRGRNARQTYNSLQCAPALLWIGEALGEDPVMVTAAANRAAGRGRESTQSAQIRAIVSWDRIVPLIAAHT